MEAATHADVEDNDESSGKSSAELERLMAETTSSMELDFSKMPASDQEP
jgi:hypothetical protein